MLLEDGETRTRRCKTFKCSEMLLEDVEAGRQRNATSWLQVPARLLKITRDHRARLVSSNRECLAHYGHIFYFFNKSSLSLFVYTRGILGCLLGFWPLAQNGQNPAGATIRTGTPRFNAFTMTSVYFSTNAILAFSHATPLLRWDTFELESCKQI